jgi:hypothetical protein
MTSTFSSFAHKKAPGNFGGAWGTIWVSVTGPCAISLELPRACSSATPFMLQTRDYDRVIGASSRFCRVYVAKAQNSLQLLRELTGKCRYIVVPIQKPVKNALFGHFCRRLGLFRTYKSVMQRRGDVMLIRLNNRLENARKNAQRRFAGCRVWRDTEVDCVKYVH